MSMIERLEASPVMATLFGPEDLDEFEDTPTAFCFLANVPLGSVRGVIERVRNSGAFAVLNVDTVKGLSPTSDGLDYLRSVGVGGIVSTHGAVVARGPAAGMLTVQKVFVTDRSNLPRISASAAQNRPHLVQLMPWPVVPRLEREFIEALPRFVVSGFVHDRADVEAARNLGAVAVSTSQRDLWRPVERP